MREEDEIGIREIITWVGCLITAFVSTLVFLYTTFETGSSFAEYKESQKSALGIFEKRLDRIEQKEDEILERVKR